MRITVTCPLCEQSMSAPSKLAGSYVTCPMCNGRFAIPADLAAGLSPAGSVPDSDAAGAPGASTSDSLAPGAGVEGARSTVRPSHGSPGGAARRPVPPAPPPPGSTPAPPSEAVPPKPPSPRASSAAPRRAPSSPPPPSAKNVARFITAEAAESKLNLAEGGMLPELRIEEGATAKGSQQNGLTVNPLVLLGLICLSVVSSVFLVLYEPETAPASDSSRKHRARQVIQSEYFADLDSPAPQEPYQRLLRAAERAYARGDRETERLCYRRVLDLLRAERNEFESLTGTPNRDRTLEQQITILLGKD